MKPAVWASLFLSILITGCADYHTARQARQNSNYTEAFSQFTKLAEFGHAPSQVELGRMYLKGESVEKSSEHAVILFERAAAQGDRRAFFELVRLYERGPDVEQDLPAAMQNYHDAALAFYGRGALALAPLVSQHGLLDDMDQDADKNVNVLALYYAAMIDKRDVPEETLKNVESSLSSTQRAQALSLAKTRYSKPNSVLPPYFLRH